MDEAPQASEARTAPPLILSGRFIVTPTIIAMNIAYFLAMVSLGVSASQPTAAEVLPFGANFGALTVNGEWWRLLSSTFIHYGFLHLAINMWALWNLGTLAERLFGYRSFLLIYVLSGLAGSAASVAWHPHVVSVGASGAIFGIAGALAALLYFTRLHLPQKTVRPLLTSLLFFIGLSLAFGFAVPGIDNAGHLGGLVSGALLGATLPRRSVFALGATAISLAIVATAPVAIRAVENNGQVMLTEAVVLVSENDLEGARRKLEESLAREPDLVRAHDLMTVVCLETGCYQRAVQSARRWVELEPQDERAHYLLGAALSLARDYERALEELEFAIQLDPENLDARVRLSRVLSELGRGDEAVAALEEALKWAPESWLLHSEMGLVLLENDELDRAVASLEKAVEAAPDEPESYNRLSLVLARAGAHDEALAAVEKAMELQPGAAHIIDSLGTVRLYRGELDEAVDAYRRAIELEPESGVYHYNLSVALERLGRADEAAATRAEALRLDPGLETPGDGSPLM